MIKIADIEALCDLVKNGDVKIYDVAVPSIYELAGYFKASVTVTENKTEATFKKGLVNITLTDLPF